MIIKHTMMISRTFGKIFCRLMRQKVELYGRFKSHYSSTLDLQQENQNDTNGLNQTQMLWCDLKQTVQAGNP